MSLITSLTDLFNAGASFVAEQFIRGRSKASNLTDLLARKFGNDLQTPPEAIATLESRVRQAAIPADAINRRTNVQLTTVPLWEGSAGPSSFIHSGLAKIESFASANSPLFSTNIPFNFHSAEIEKLEDIAQKIRGAFDSSPAEVQEKYQADINRIDQAIRYHRILEFTETINPEVYGVYRSGSLG